MAALPQPEALRALFHIDCPLSSDMCDPAPTEPLSAGAVTDHEPLFRLDLPGVSLTDLHRVQSRLSRAKELLNKFYSQVLPTLKEQPGQWAVYSESGSLNILPTEEAADAEAVRLTRLGDLSISVKIATPPPAPLSVMCRW